MKILSLVLLACAAVACADEMPRDVQEATATVDSAALVPDTTDDGAVLVPGDLPPGGYAAWITDIRLELPAVLEVAAEDRSNALEVLLQLYMTRQQPLSEHFGEGGRTVASVEMAQAVTLADRNFQELIRQVAAEDVTAEALFDAAMEVERALAAAEAAGTAAGLDPAAPRGGATP